MLGDLVAVAESEGLEPDEHADLEPADEALEQKLLWLLRRHGVETPADVDRLRADAEEVALFRWIEELEYALDTLIGNPVPQDAD